MDLDYFRRAAATMPQRPRVYFEEWNDPLISGIQWVEELIEIAGGDPIFPELRTAHLAKNRIVTPDEIIRRSPDIIVASWCGKRVRTETIAARAGWSSIPAVRNRHLYELKSSLILQPGPAALTDGIRHLQQIIMRASKARVTSPTAI
jgi:iron complex transport system substrate-binding protein